MIKIKRIYDEYAPSDGFRILADRLWPRGVTKERAKVDLWLKDIAPSSELRKWFSHDPEKWDEFKKQYKAELDGKKELLDEIKRIEKKEKIITILYAAKDDMHNHAVVLIELL